MSIGVRLTKQQSGTQRHLFSSLSVFIFIAVEWCSVFTVQVWPKRERKLKFHSQKFVSPIVSSLGCLMMYVQSLTLEGFFHIYQLKRHVKDMSRVYEHVFVTSQVVWKTIVKVVDLFVENLYQTQIIFQANQFYMS